MTKEEIIEMAIHAGFDEHHAAFDTRIKAFAKLVAEKEREECAKVADGWPDYDVQGLAEAIRARGEKA